MIYGYARVSTKKIDPETGEFVQTTDLQRDALLNSGIMPENIFEDRASGAKEERPGLDAMLSTVKPGDTITIWKLDRLGRNARHLLQIAEKMKAKGVSIRSLQDGIDTSGAMGGFMLTILSAVAELEREIISDRVKAGIAASIKNGGRIGRKPALTNYQMLEVVRRLDAGESGTQIGRDNGISKQTVYGIRNRLRKRGVV